MRYLPRVVDAQVQRGLTTAGAIVIEGAKACGKTTTALQVAESSIRLDRDAAMRAAGQTDPTVLLPGAVPHLIDEWQLVPEVWNAIRVEVDDRGKPGQFVLTGSATPADDASRHSGAMRFLRIPMRPMSLYESGISDGSVSLRTLWADGQFQANPAQLSLDEVANWACRGGWPGLENLSLEAAQELNHSYLRTVSATDIVLVDGVRRDPRKVQALLGALGRNSGTYVSNRRLQTDSEAFGERIDPATVQSYLNALERLWVLVPQFAWGGHLRSAAAARRAPKRHLVDPSLAAAAMGADPEDLVREPEAFGQVFETMVFRDLSIYGQANGLEPRAFQDAKGNEIDLVLVRGTKWAGIEVKLSANPNTIDAAATNLLAISARMRSQPNFLAIVTANGPTYSRPDGVRVVSIGHLAP
ncbi:MAG: DUF4143 domain-containing protein [Promicromonosporaceae bacterium]|nr:DUF4143 domain-containing protein [Promicromonosporaceae bacterium]